MAEILGVTFLKRLHAHYEFNPVIVLLELQWTSQCCRHLLSPSSFISLTLITDVSIPGEWNLEGQRPHNGMPGRH